MSRARDIANYGDGIDTSSITSGTFADARIAQSNVTQHESAIDALGTVTTGTFNGTIGTSATPPAGSIVQHIQGIETSAWALASGGSDTNTQSITPRSYNTTNGYFVLEWFIEGYKDSTAGQGRASVEISYDGGTYSTVGKSFNYLTYIHPNGGTSPFGIMSQAVSRKTYLQGTLEHTFRLKILAQSGSFYVYADSHMWNIYEVYHP